MKNPVPASRDGVSNTVGLLPSPACGRGAGGEGRRLASTMRPRFVEAPALTPAPLP
ncbi:hypothetical protein CO2235_200242 [Cupriavidus oxalaticus]|uniref:Uncharacterized protein n=1 Tax=Cupriavidus oxalaticus TaxID=96344 RepID=A0A976BD62_9BURK|nr:hypothetical protein CO2235_200242 [Cupriavidus oxalaticus]